MSIVYGGSMSEKIPVVEIKDPRVNLDEKKAVGSVVSSAEASWIVQSANSVSNSNLSWNILPPNNSVINPRWYIKTNITYVVAGTTASGNMLNLGLADAVRFMPLQSCINSMILQINGLQTSVNSSDMISALGHTLDPRDLAQYASATGAMLDQYQQYADNASTGGSGRNPLGVWGDSFTTNDQPPMRGSINMTVNSNTTTAFSVTFEITEPIIGLSPLQFGKESEKQPWLANVQNIQLNVQLGSLARIWSHYAGTNTSAISSSTVTINSAQLLLQYLTPSGLASKVDQEKTYTYPHFEITPYSQNSGSLAAGSTASVTSQNIQTTCVPSKILVYARQRNADQSVTSSDTFAAIDSLSVTFNNKSSLLASASAYDLWRISVSNGLKVPYLGFNTFQGSVVILDPARDLGLPADQAIGSSGNNQFQLTATIRNSSNYLNATGSGATINYTLYVLPILPGSYSISKSSASSKVGLLDSAAVLKAKSNPYFTYQDYQDTGSDGFMGGSSAMVSSLPRMFGMGKYSKAYMDKVYGGDFFSDAWDWTKGAINDVADVAGKVVPFLPMLGLGYKHKSARQTKRAVRGGCSSCVEELSNNNLEKRLSGISDDEDEKSLY